jgi:polysaccharide pyruvyl transferase WcaK-like protein
MPLRIGLLWHSLASGNLGVDALTVANMAIVRVELAKRGIEGTLVVIGPGESYDGVTLPPNTEIFAISGRSMLSLDGYWRLLGDLDCIVDIGAGDSFADIYGPKRFFYIYMTKKLALVRGVPLLFAPQTIGPFTKPVYKQLAASVMKRADAVIARDEGSLVAISQLAPRTRAVLATDVAFELPYVDRSGERASKRGGGRLRIGVNASGLLLGDAVSGQYGFGLSYDYRAFISLLLSELSARSDCEIHLISHAISASDAADHDGLIADSLAREYPGAIRVPDFASASVAKSYLSSLDFLVAGRMHACVGAFSAGVPVVPTAYSRKFSGLFGLLGYDHILPVQGFDAEAAKDFVLDRLARREELASEIGVAMSKTAQLLEAYKGELRRLLDRTQERGA